MLREETLERIGTGLLEVAEDGLDFMLPDLSKASPKKCAESIVAAFRYTKSHKADDYRSYFQGAGLIK